MATDDPSGKTPQTIDVADIRARGFSTAKAIIEALAELDQRIGLATEQTCDDRAALLEAARRLADLIDTGGAAR